MDTIFPSLKGIRFSEYVALDSSLGQRQARPEATNRQVPVWLILGDFAVSCRSDPVGVCRKSSF